MFNWILKIVSAIIAIQPACFCWWTIQRNRELKSSLVLDWGPQPNRVRNWGFAALITSTIWILWDDQPDLERVSMQLWLGLIAIYTVLSTLPHLGIYQDGIHLMAKFLWGANARFIRWHEIQNYRWEEQGRLVINSGWSPIICRIPEDRIIDLKAILKEKCPDAERTIQPVKPGLEGATTGAERFHQSTQ